MLLKIETLLSVMLKRVFLSVARRANNKKEKFGKQHSFIATFLRTLCSFFLFIFSSLGEIKDYMPL
jgi:hypothetical protein